MNEFDELVSRDGVLMAGRFGPDGRIAEHKSTGWLIEYPPALEMAQWFCAAVTAMFNSMAFAANSVSPAVTYQASWLPVKGWAFFGGDYSVAVYNGKFLLAESEKVKSFDELRRLLRKGEPCFSYSASSSSRRADLGGRSHRRGQGGQDSAKLVAGRNRAGNQAPTGGIPAPGN